MSNKEKTFARLAYERLISNFLSVKVWLFLIPMTLSVIFLYWVVGLTIDTTILIENSLSNSNEIVEISKTGLTTIKEMFTGWLKFTGSLVVSIVGVREIWKINKIREETKRSGKE